MARPAVPATVRFRMRFVKADGSPLANTWYRIRWGRLDAAPSKVAQTNSDGQVEEVLDGRFARGIIEFGDNDWKVPDDKGFVPRLAVDLVLLQPPGPPPKHKRMGDDAPPSKPAVAPPPEPPDPIPPPPPPGLISMPPDGSTHDFDPEGRRPPPKPRPAKTPTIEVKRLLEKLDRIASDYHDKQVKVFQIAWRLHNLGFLGLWSGHVTFPIDGGKYADLLDALNRYAWKHGLPLLKDVDLTGPDDTLSEIWEHIEKTHDGW